MATVEQHKLHTLIERLDKATGLNRVGPALRVFKQHHALAIVAGAVAHKAQPRGGDIAQSAACCSQSRRAHPRQRQLSLGLVRNLHHALPFLQRAQFAPLIHRRDRYRQHFERGGPCFGGLALRQRQPTHKAQPLGQQPAIRLAQIFPRNGAEGGIAHPQQPSTGWQDHHGLALFGVGKDRVEQRPPKRNGVAAQGGITAVVHWQIGTGEGVGMPSILHTHTVLLGLMGQANFVLAHRAAVGLHQS